MLEIGDNPNRFELSMRIIQSLILQINLKSTTTLSAQFGSTISITKSAYILSEKPHTDHTRLILYVEYVITITNCERFSPMQGTFFRFA